MTRLSALEAAALALAVLFSACTTVSSSPPDKGEFALWSPTFADGATVTDVRYQGKMAGNLLCKGENLAPALMWRNVPAGTRSLAMIVYDQAGFGGLGVTHFVAYGIAPSVSGFVENEIAQPPGRYVAGADSLKQGRYLGPCPPQGTGLHAYTFTLIASDVEPNALPSGLTMQELLDRLKGHQKGASTIVLRFRPI